MRHILKRLAPENEVLQCIWYKNATHKPNGITGEQRARYAVPCGLSDLHVNEAFGLSADADHKALAEAVDKLSKYTHVEPETFAIADVEVQQRTQDTLSAVARVLQTVDECRDRLIQHLEWDIDTVAIEEVVADPLAGIDELASHFSLENVSVSSVKVTAIDHAFIHMTVDRAVPKDLWLMEDSIGVDTEEWQRIRYGADEHDD